MERAALGVVAAAYAICAWLRLPEPPGLDQSLFAFYGRCIGRGLHLYSDLWDSKPPALFLFYALAERVTGVAHAAWLLDTLASAAFALLAYKLARPAGALAGVTAASLGVFLPVVPALGGPLLAGQAEVLSAPLLLGAVLFAARPGWRAGAWAGALLGVAASLKVATLVLLPLLLIFTPRGERLSPRRVLATLAGLALVPGACTAYVAWQGGFIEGVQAILAYPRAYAGVIQRRMQLLPALGRGAGILVHAMPVTLVLALLGALALRRNPLSWRALVWLGLAALAAGLQRQMAGYQLFLLAAPLALLAALGAQHAWCLASGVWRRGLPIQPAHSLALTLLACALAVGAANEMRAAVSHYWPHVLYRGGTLSRVALLQHFGTPGTLWMEAENLVAAMRADATLLPPYRPGELRRHIPPQDAILVWGLAPAVYALSGCEPVTRYAFHQTLLVEGSPLSERWPDVERRRVELLQRMHEHPPRFVVVVRGDRSGLEPTDSARELQDFEMLEHLLALEYRPDAATRSYTLWVRAEPGAPAPPERFDPRPWRHVALDRPTDN